MEHCNGTATAETMRSQLYTFLERKPEYYDVSFCVGPQKTIVKALKVILISSSSFFEKEFEDNWNKAILKDSEGIPLPDLDPTAFQLFVKLMISDTWSLEALQKLKLPADQLLNLILICDKYNIKNGVQNLNILTGRWIRNFDTFVSTDAFLNLSESNLKTLLSSDEIPLTEREIFEHVQSWAEVQCEVKELEITDGANLREVLGSCLYEIRFPTMSIQEFTKVIITLKGILTADEIISVYTHYGKDDDDEERIDEQLKFRTDKRNNRSTLELCEVYKVNKSSRMVCNGVENYLAFKTNRKIKLTGISFLGPVDTSGLYKVKICIKRKVASSTTAETEIFPVCKKNFFAEVNDYISFNFDKPILLEAIPFDGWSAAYKIYYCLKGPETQQFIPDGTGKKMRCQANEFNFCCSVNSVAKIQFYNC